MVNIWKAIRCSLLVCALFCSGCISTIVGTATDVAIEVVKVPFKAGAAVADAFGSGGEEENTTDKKDVKKE